MFKDGKCVAMRAGMANEFQLDKFLEDSLPELEKTFDSEGLKMLPVLRLPEESNVVVEAKEDSRTKEEDILRQMSNLSFKAEEEEDGTEPVTVVVTTVQQEIEKVIKDESVTIEEGDCIDPVECWERLEKTPLWQNRTVVPAMDGIMSPARSYGSP